ncbi:MAG: hypothetical protein U1C96_01740 [Gallionella sp.]|nr:hypothetical protein [Gallionella sp.]
MKHLLVDISAHGYGHLAQTAPVVDAMVGLMPGLRVTVRSASPPDILRQHFNCSFQLVPCEIDFGMRMLDAVEVDVSGSLAAYRDYHSGWDDKVSRAAAEMRLMAPDLILANVPYLSLAAAHQADIPAVAMCCLNWADIYRHYAGNDAGSLIIQRQMQAAYDSAACFLKVLPAMPMCDLHNVHEIQPIARRGQDRRAEIERLIPGGKNEKLVLVGMGGIAYRLPMARWLRHENVRWIVPADWDVQRDDTLVFESLGMSFSDVLASCDAVLTKPGYGIFTEAACAGVPLLYVSRGNWPEQPCLVEWLEQNGVCREIEAAALQRGELGAALSALWGKVKPPRPAANGANQAAGILAGWL